MTYVVEDGLENVVEFTHSLEALNGDVLIKEEVHHEALDYHVLVFFGVGFFELLDIDSVYLRDVGHNSITEVLKHSHQKSDSAHASDLITKCFSILEDMLAEAKHHIDWSLVIEDLASLEEILWVLDHVVDEWNRSLRNHIVNNSSVLNIYLDNMDEELPHFWTNLLLVVDEFGDAGKTFVSRCTSSF